jgi:hypothetical protein
MTRRFIAGAAVCALGGLFGGAGQAMAATGGCQLSGTAVFSSPLGTTAKAFDYSFGGTLTNCKGDAAGTPATGTISSNQPITSGGITYYPSYKDTGNGSCGSSTTSGTAVITWADGTVTVESYSTTGVTAAINLQGAVLPSVTYTGTSTDPLGNPITVTKTFTTTRYLGGKSIGQLAFEANPADCVSGSVNSAGIAGVVGLY